jgi:ribosomal protein S18 acetylase RimI-like enzyme
MIAPMSAALVQQAANLHVRALAGSRSAIMGRAYAATFIEFFRLPQHGGIALAAIDPGGKLAGYVVGAPLGYPAALSRSLARVSVAALGWRPWVLFRRAFREGLTDRLRLRLGLLSPRLAEPGLPAPTMSLVAIAVDPSMRGRRIGMRLVEAFEVKARNAGMRSLRLSMRPNNTIARRLYERCGWRLLNESPAQADYGRILE